MVYTYYIDVTQFEDRNLYQEKLRLLSLCRQRRTARLKLEKDRQRSLGAGLALDHALRIYGPGLRERDMEYVFGEWGKPSFRDYPEIHFSLSHSGDYALCSIGECPVGNDIERIRPGKLKVAERFYTDQELEFLYRRQEDAENIQKVCVEDVKGHSGIDEEEVMKRMFRMWTMKESFLKVTGQGMTLPLKDFSVIVDAKTDTARVEYGSGNAVYRMKEYEDIPGYRAAVCCQADSETAENMAPVVF